MTPQHPAAPEAETDANGRMSMGESIALQRAFDRDKWAGEWNSLPTAIDRLLADRATAARERVRVVEGERDAARADLAFSRQTTTNVMDALAESGAETVAAEARAESAEAAHEAEVAETAARIARAASRWPRGRMTDHERTQAALNTYIAWGIERAQHHANQRTTP